jgi:hypothetical protein
MVVKYYDQSRVAFGDRNFHGVLACGEARTDNPSTEADREIDRFLRFAEPPEHDDWISTENLRERYQRGFRTALDDMFGTLRDGLRHIVARSDGSADTLSQRVRKQFPIHGDISRSRSIDVPSTVFDIQSESTFEDGRWTFDGSIEVLEDDYEEWTAEISLQGVGEDGGTYDEIPIESLDHSTNVTDENSDGTVRITSENGVGVLDFEGESVPVDEESDSSIAIGETRLEIRAELRTGGES